MKDIPSLKFNTLTNGSSIWYKAFNRTSETKKKPKYSVTPAQLSLCSFLLCYIS